MSWVLFALNVLVLLGLVALGLLLKSYLPGYAREKGKNLATKEDVEEITHKIESVRSQYTSDAEKLRAELRVTAHERETRFARLHERRADAIDGLYRRLVKAHETFYALTGGIVQSEHDTPEARLEAAGDAARELLSFFNENRLYFDHQLKAAFGKFERALASVWNTLAFHQIDDWRQMPRPERERRVAERTKAIETIRDKIPALREKMEKEMRIALGEAVDSDENEEA